MRPGRDSRARALFVSKELLPVVAPLLQSHAYLKKIFVIGGEAPEGMLSFGDELAQSETRPAIPVSADECAFWLYSSGSTGQPKGVLHTSAGYLVFASMTHQYVFDYHDGDIYWCTADVGWVTGSTSFETGPDLQMTPAASVS